MRGEEKFVAAREIQSGIDAIFQIRYDAGVKPIMHIRYNGADYDIVSIQEIGRREGLEIVARRRGGSGNG
jgi:SPP1 family predicted phage head-tail adaptor